MLYFKICVVLLCDVLAVYILLNTLYVLLVGAPAISSSCETEEKLAKVISKLQRKKKFVFVDLGSGTGELIFKLSKSFPMASFVGVEVNPFIVFYCNLKKRMKNSENVQFVRENIFNVDINKYKPDFIYLYLGRDLSKKISKKLKKKVSLNTYVLSNKFELSYLKLVDVVEYNRLINGPLRIYKNKE